MRALYNFAKKVFACVYFDLVLVQLSMNERENGWQKKREAENFLWMSLLPRLL